MRLLFLAWMLVSVQLADAARQALFTLASEEDDSTAAKPEATLAKLQKQLAQLKQYNASHPEIKGIKKKIKAVKKEIKNGPKAKFDQFKRNLDQRIQRLGEQIAQSEYDLRDVLAARRAEVRVEYDQNRQVHKQVVEVKEKASHDVPVIDVEIPSAENSVAVDPCCDGSADGRKADDAAPDGSGMYTIIVKHSGLSLSTSGAPGSCDGSSMSLPSVYVEYLCPQQCTPDPRNWFRWNEIFANNDQVSEADVEDCSIDNCRGTCFNPHDSGWSTGKVVGVEAPRLKECAVTGGWRYGGQSNPQVVMTSSCRARFEVARQLFFDKLD